MSGWASPEPSLPRPMAPPGMAGLVEVLGLWPQHSRNSSSRVAEASLCSCQGLGQARWWAHSSTFLGGSWASRLDPWTWLAESLACVLCASLRVCMYPGGSLGWGVGTKDLCAWLAPSSQALCLGFSICQCGPRSG